MERFFSESRVARPLFSAITVMTACAMQAAGVPASPRASSESADYIVLSVSYQRDTGTPASHSVCSPVWQLNLEMSLC